MKVPEGFVVIHQPKYKVPGIFDLNDRGRFAERPSVTANWGFRILADKAHDVRLQVAMLVHEPGKDPQTGRLYDWMVKEAQITLDENLVPDPLQVDRLLPDADIRATLSAHFKQWHASVVPMTETGAIDRQELKKKLTALVADAETSTRKALAHKNQGWVLANIPRRVHDFKYGLYNRVKENLFQEYQNNGGEDSEDNLIKKIALFNRVLENCGQKDLLKPDGSGWKNEDEIWQCWIGFAGCEAEARRICRTMDTVFSALQW